MEHAVKTDKIAHFADVAFHKAIADATKNPMATLVLQTISDALAERSRKMNEVPGVLEEGLREHRRIYLAIKEHNPEKARQARMLIRDESTAPMRGLIDKPVDRTAVRGHWAHIVRELFQTKDGLGTLESVITALGSVAGTSAIPAVQQSVSAVLVARLV